MKKRAKNVIILCNKKEYYRQYIDEKIFYGKCKECNEELVYGEITLRQAKEEFSGEIKFICRDCHLKLPKFGKYIRPNNETMDALRKDNVNMNIDEVKIRETMKKIKNKDYL